MDYFLRPHVERLSSYLKDTIHLLETLEDICVLPETTLASKDAEVLYSSIPHLKGLRDVKSFFDEMCTHCGKINVCG